MEENPEKDSTSTDAKHVLFEQERHPVDFLVVTFIGDHVLFCLRRLAFCFSLKFKMPKQKKLPQIRMKKVPLDQQIIQDALPRSSGRAKRKDRDEDDDRVRNSSCHE